MTLPIKRIIVEGCDLAGKSTLIRSFHKKTKFKYNVHDRSFLSMVVYARQFDRKDDEARHRAALMEELCDLNNLMVVLIPPLQTILDRFKERGDDIQTLDSLVRLHQLFLDESQKLESYPNVLVLKNELPLEELTRVMIEDVKEHESCSVDVAGDLVRGLIHASGSTEMQAQIKLLVPHDYYDSPHLESSHEAFYFQDIEIDFFVKIRREIAGDNPYKTPQGLDSRRFYYSSDTCISSIHFLPRHGGLKAVVTCRSTDVDRNAQLDTRFLAHLAAGAAREFGWNNQNKPIDLTINYNSAHIRTDLPRA
jgi:thymidylate kinase